MLTESIAVTLHVVQILEDLDIPYFIGGSLASAVHGVARATMDVDLVAALRIEHVGPLLAQLGDDFYADESAIREAVNRGSTFNLIHLASMFKVDVFVSTGRPFEQAEFARRALQTLADEPHGAAYVASAEDLILAKLRAIRENRRFHNGGETSDRQWRDILDVIQVQGPDSDSDYLRTWATRLGVSNLLERAMGQSTRVDS